MHVRLFQFRGEIALFSVQLSVGRALITKLNNSNIVVGKRSRTVKRKEKMTEKKPTIACVSLPRAHFPSRIERQERDRNQATLNQLRLIKHRTLS